MNKLDVALLSLLPEFILPLCSVEPFRYRNSPNEDTVEKICQKR